MLSRSHATTIEVTVSDARARTLFAFFVGIVLSLPLYSFAADPSVVPDEPIKKMEVVSDRLVLASETHPDENKWYSSRNVTFSWNLPTKVIAVRTLYDEEPLFTPNKVYDPPIRKKSFVTEKDGIMYMHVQWKFEDGWGTVAHRKFQIDTVPPKNLTVAIFGGATTTNPTPAVNIKAEDELSGLDRFSLSIDGGNEVFYSLSPSNIYKLPKLRPGNHEIIISAYDKASNRVQATTSILIKALNAPLITSYTKQITRGGTLTAEGRTYPGMTVEASFTDEDKHVAFATAKAHNDGSYSLVWADPKAGVYEMSLRVVNNTGASSYWTEGRLVIVKNIALMRIGTFIINWLSLALVIVLAFVTAVAVLWYSLLQFNRFRRKIHRTLKEAENTLKTNVQALRRDTEEFHTVLQKAEKKRDLTKEEQAIMRKFKKRLDTLDKEIERKLEQIS